MSYLYGITDTKFQIRKMKWHEKRHRALKKECQFRINPVIAQNVDFDHYASPISFRVHPASLVELAVNVVDKLPLPSVFEWTKANVKNWICRYGYPQYMSTFEVNMISGRKLLLVDAAALSAMNIKDFEHIKHITYGIRMLFHFQLTKYSSDVSLPEERPNELYLLWHTQTGLNYDAVRRSDLYKRLLLLEERSPDLEHWDLLRLWLARERQRKYTVLVSSRQKPASHPPVHVEKSEFVDESKCSHCIPPCDCCWTPNDIRLPWRLSVLSNPLISSARSRCLAIENVCLDCQPPCECHWLSRYYLTNTVLKCLKESFPEKFSAIFEEDPALIHRPSVMERWIRFSI